MLVSMSSARAADEPIAAETPRVPLVIELGAAVKWRGPSERDLYYGLAEMFFVWGVNSSVRKKAAATFEKLTSRSADDWEKGRVPGFTCAPGTSAETFC